MPFTRYLILFLTLILSSCSSDSGDDSTLPVPLRDITTPNDFANSIVGRQLVLMNTDGTRNVEAQLVINANMKVTGFTQTGSVDLDWFWDNSAWCRSGVTGLPNTPTTVELECQGVKLDNNIVTFTRDRGTGEIASSWFIE